MYTSTIDYVFNILRSNYCVLNANSQFAIIRFAHLKPVLRYMMSRICDNRPMSVNTLQQGCTFVFWNSPIEKIGILLSMDLVNIRLCVSTNRYSIGCLLELDQFDIC